MHKINKMLFGAQQMYWPVYGRAGALEKGKILWMLVVGKREQKKEGDIVEGKSHIVGGDAQAAFVSDEAVLWPKGFIPYRIETVEYGFGPEPVFTDTQIENITQSLQQICRDVPCIEFKCHLDILQGEPFQ